MQSLYVSLVHLDLLCLVGFICIITIVKGNRPLTVIGWVGAGFWVINLIYDFVKILTL